MRVDYDLLSRTSANDAPRDTIHSLAATLRRRWNPGEFNGGPGVTFPRMAATQHRTQDQTEGGNRGQTGRSPFFSAQCGNGTHSRDPEIARKSSKVEAFLIFSAHGTLRSRRRG